MHATFFASALCVAAKRPSENVKIGSGVYIDGGMLVTSEDLLTRELEATYILERGGKQWTAELLGQTLIGANDPPYVFRIEPL